MTHTPRPWTIGASHNDEYQGPPGETAIMAGDFSVAVALPTGSTGDLMPDITLANAKLIAAAPDMLEALQNVRSLISEAAMTGFDWKEGDWAARLFFSQQKTSAAIEKATD